MADDRLSNEARILMRHATVADLKADCAELSRFYAEMNPPDRALLAALFEVDTTSSMRAKDEFG